MGNYNHRLLLIQCKDLAKTISIKEIKEFEASVRKYPKRGTFCIFVSSKKSHASTFNKGFSPDAIDWAKNCEYDILLTNIHNLQTDIINYEFKNLREDEEIEEIKKSYLTLDKKLDKINNENKDLIFYVKIVILLLIILIIILIFILIFKQ